MHNKLHIYEEATYLFWGLIIVVSTTLATYLLANAFLNGGFSFSSLNQIIALMLFTLSFVGILKISEPLYHFTFEIRDKQLVIHTKKGEQHIQTDTIALNRIDGLKFSPYLPRSKGEALFDFSTNYQVMIKRTMGSEYRPLINLEDAAFTLKVNDIVKIIRFVKKHQPQVHVPREQAEVFNL